MKKNKWMRLASVLLVLCLLTTSVISGTFAKYVTKDSASDQARVAKWGIVLDINGKLFDDSYFDARESDGNEPGTAGSAAVSVLASTDDDDIVPFADDEGSNGLNRVVAPGTQNTEGMKFSVKGTAETSVRIDYVLQLAEDDDSDPLDIFLAEGEYRDWTVSGQNEQYPETFDSALYYPVVFTLVQTKDASGELDPVVPVASGTLADIKEALEAISGTEYAPNTVLDAEFQLTWAWDFDDNGSGTYDKQDTLLGNLAAGEGEWGDGSTFNFAEVSVLDTPATADDPAEWTEIDADAYSLLTQFYFEVSVTQVD